MRNLPDWVLKYKTKGTNVILKNGKYYLYKVHSERRKDKNYPVLVTDEYLGVITENGLLKKKENIKKVIVKEFGLSNYYFNKLNNLNIDINKHISLTILFTYKELTLEAFNYSYLSIDYPNFIIDNDVIFHRYGEELSGGKPSVYFSSSYSDAYHKQAFLNKPRC